MGEEIQKIPTSSSAKIPRNKYFNATKMGRYELDMPNMFNFTAEKVTQSAEESLKRLQLDSVDLL